MTMVKVGLIGYGFGGRIFHAPILTAVPGFELSMIYETKQQNIELIHERYPNAQVVSDVEAIFSSLEICLVVIATPNVMHYPYAVRALESSKHVLVEKPFTCTSREADELIALSRKTGKILTVNHNRRWDSDFLTVRKIVENNMLGELVEYEVHYDKYRPEVGENWRIQKTTAAAGHLYDLGSHLIDQALQLFGLPEEVFGYLDAQRTGCEVTDAFEVILRYPSLKVTLKSSMLVREPSPHYALYGKSGSFIKFGMDVQEDELIAGKSPSLEQEWGREPEKNAGRICTEINGVTISGTVESEAGDYRELYRNVYNAIQGVEDLIVKPEQARDVIRIIELAEQSSEQKRWLRYADGNKYESITI